LNRALLVGINTYPGCPLRGCVNDVNNMAEYLVQYQHFAEEDIRLLTDSRATTDAILERLTWLVAGTQPGDRIMFHYSGHGATFAGRGASDEIDHVDDVICPVDFDWSPEHMIEDEDFRSIFANVPEGVCLTWISDSCHSGHLDRDLPPTPRQPRAFPTPADMAWRLRTAAARGLTVPMAVFPGQFISGCRSDQTSADALVGLTYQGALTSHLLAALKARPELSVVEVVDATARQLSLDGFDQQPQADGERIGNPLLA
jgi:metacaspase-1